MADLKTLLGDDFKDEMTIEEINAALSAKNYVDKNLFDRTKSDLVKTQKEKKDLEEKGMTAEEKLKQALEAAETTKKEFTIKANRIDVEKIFLKGGLSEKDYADFLDGIVTDSLDDSRQIAEKIVGAFNAKATEVEKEVKEKLLKDTPRPPAGGGSGKPIEITQEIFNAMGYQDLVKLLNDDPELYKKLTGG